MGTSELVEFVVCFVVAILHLGYFCIDFIKIGESGRSIRALLHYIIFALKLLMLHKSAYFEHREVRVCLTLAILVPTFDFDLCILPVLHLYGMHYGIKERLIMIIITCQSGLNQLYELTLEIWETRLALISNPLSWLWKKGKEVLDPEVARLTQLVLFLHFFGHHNILASIVSLVYGTWDDYLSQSGIGDRVEGVYEEFKEMAKTKFCKKYFRVPDGLDPQNHIYTIRNIEFCGFNIVELRIETRVLPDSDPEGVRCIRCFGMDDIYGEWFPVPSASAG